MKKILTINLSPRNKGTSIMLLNECRNYLSARGDKVDHINLYSHLNNMDPIFEKINSSDTLILSGPCYVNTYPADTIKLLEELSKRPNILHGQNLYGIIQGGMPYSHTHESGLKILEVFSNKVNLKYNGGFVIGLGAMVDGQSFNTLPNGKKVKRQFEIFCNNIHKAEKSPNSVYETSILKIPRPVTRFLAYYMNKKINKKFSERGMDANAPSPYHSVTPEVTDGN